MAVLQNRVPAGTTEGGRFSALARVDPGTDVLTEPVDWGEQPPDDIAFAQMSASVQHFAPMGMSRDQVDDVTQDAALQYCLALERRRAHASNGKTVAPIKDYAGFIHSIARRSVWRSLHPERSEDAAAYRRYQDICDARTGTLGRPLTGAERDEIADGIRRSAPPGRRPSADFHTATRRRALSLDAPARVAGGSPGSDEPRKILLNRIADRTDAAWDPTSIPSPTDSDFAEGSKAVQIEDLIAEGGSLNFRRGRTMAWDAVAEMLHKPQAVPGAVTERQATQVRRIAAEAGGAHVLVDAWRDETITDAQADALFAPFGRNLPYATQADVVEAFDTCGLYGDEAWDAAVAAATKKRSTPPSPSPAPVGPSRSEGSSS